MTNMASMSRRAPDVVKRKIHMSAKFLGSVFHILTNEKDANSLTAEPAKRPQQVQNRRMRRIKQQEESELHFRLLQLGSEGQQYRLQAISVDWVSRLAVDRNR
jgi:hypothetical protein